MLLKLENWWLQQAKWLTEILHNAPSLVVRTKVQLLQIELQMAVFVTPFSHN
jgi:hypothetical protein